MANRPAIDGFTKKDLIVGEWNDPPPTPQGKAMLDVDQALVEIHRKRAKGNATAGVVNSILLDGLDNNVLSREARGAIVSTDMLMPDERARVEEIRQNRDSPQCTALLAILDGIAPYV